LKIGSSVGFYNYDATTKHIDVYPQLLTTAYLRHNSRFRTGIGLEIGLHNTQGWQPSLFLEEEIIFNIMAKAMVTLNKDAAKSLEDLFEDCLKDALWAENAVKDALPKMIKNVTSAALKKALTDHLEATKQHVKIVKEVFKVIGVKAEEEKCDAMQGILDEGEGILESTLPGPVRDAGIIAACQKVEHYEIASYGTMAAYARHLKQTEAKKLIESILKEEKSADKLLSKLAVQKINVAANKYED